MTVNNAYNPDYRGCKIKVKSSKRKYLGMPTWEAQVFLPNADILYIQSEITKIKLFRSARHIIDEYHNKGDVCRRWFSMPLV